MKLGISLTNRDIELLSFLKGQGVATSTQLTEQYFVSPESFRKRIALLIRNGLVVSIPIAKSIDQVPSRMLELRQKLIGEGKKWQQAKIYRIAPAFLGKGKKGDTALHDPKFWQHQIGLNDIRCYFKKLLPKDGLFLTDPEIRAFWARFGFGSEVPIPDLVFKREGFQVAFEFERTKKRDLQYFSRMSKYQESIYTKVLYIANSSDIEQVLIGASKGFPKIGVTTKITLERVRVGLFGVVSIGDFLK